MLRSGLSILSGFILIIALAFCNKSEELIIESVVTGPVNAKPLFDFAPEKYGIPDVFLEDEMVLKFGHNEIRVFHSPGHGQATLIAEEKLENPMVSESAGSLLENF